MKNILKFARLILVFVLVLSLFTVGCKKKTGDLKGESGQTESESETKESQTESEEPPKGELAFVLNEDGQSYSVSGIGTFTGKEIIIPSTHEGLEVTEIADEAFKGNLEITRLVIPTTVKKVGNSAFWYCKGIKEIDFGLGLEEIGEESFGMCTGLKIVRIPDSVKIIGKDSFKNCLDLAIVEIGDSVTEIYRGAFGFCKNLVKVTIGKSVSSIEKNVFFADDKLIEVCNKSNVLIEKGSSENGMVGYYADRIYNPENEESRVSVTDNGCVLYSHGERVVLMAYIGNEDVPIVPEGVTEIYASTFCHIVLGVVIPKTLKSVPYLVFSYDASETSKISAVYYCGSEEEWNMIQVNDGEESSNLFEIPRYYYSEEKPTENGNFWYYGENGQIVIW